jgi:hypothetical protein
MEKLKEDPIRLAQAIRKVAQLFGANHVGFTEPERRWIYSRWYDEESQESYPILFSDEKILLGTVVTTDRSIRISKDDSGNFPGESGPFNSERNAKWVIMN